MDANKRNELHQKLKEYHGIMKDIAVLSDVTPNMVYMVLAGKRKSSNVLANACKVLADKEKEEAENRALQAKYFDEAKQYSDGLLSIEV